MGKVLIVEDNPDNSFLARKILEHYGHECVIAEDGKSAIEACNAGSFDLILMDMSLPDKDGLSVTKEIRAIEAYSSTPIIALTAHTTELMQKQVKEGGCTAFIGKPFEPKQLKEIVEQYLKAA